MTATPLATRLRRAAAAMLTAALAAGAFTACSADTGNGSGDAVVPLDPDNPVAFRWAEKKSDPSLVRIADELGLWEGTGVRPEYVGEVDSAQMPALLGTGDITFAGFMFNRALSAVAAGVDLKVISGWTYTTEDQPHMEYFVRADSPIDKTNLKALEGRTVGLGSLKGCAEFILKDYLVKNGVDITKVKFLTQSETLLPQSLEQGEIDLAVLHPPLNGVVRNNPALKVAFSDYDNSGSDGGLAPIAASGAFIRKYPEHTREFVRVLGKTANWANAHPEEYREIVARLSGLPKEHVSKYYFTNNLILDKEQTGFWWGLLDRVGVLTPQEAALKPEDVATNEFNPYAPSAALIESQAENTKILTDTEI
ncbi:ABC transporter substrate-binding protein [uncultured Mycolicibacterium sp.]|jgi:ABC-type nitrate/sulfonate/bicarbonate transport systems, periplasmic components|uniref:ABC transporter substrate-binding protein n=1 Tax=uncultured Mycolicibacterium sp. TaxID=2320817 RepID=UPI0026066069|nr:ABC transporter substrate-binding protein [uncultured Mycolicibacterium sp.]